MKVFDWRRRCGVEARALTCLAIALVTVIPVLAAPGHANWYGISGYSAICPSDGNIQDNKQVDFDFTDPSVDMLNASAWVRTNLLDPTQLDTTHISNGDETTDVVGLDRYYTDWCEDTLGREWTTNGVNGWWGLTACYNLKPNDRCDRQVVRISNHFWDNRTDEADRWIFCHEVGHAIGLIHRNTGSACMLNTGDIGARSYTTHDEDHIDSAWLTEPRSDA